MAAHKPISDQRKLKPVSGLAINDSASHRDGWAARCEHWLQLAERRSSVPERIRGRRPPLILSGHGVRLRIDHGTLMIRPGLTHYPKEREELRLFPGDWRLPSRIVVLDGSGSVTFDVLEWLSCHAVPLVQINWRGEVVHVAGVAYALDEKLVRAQLAAKSNGRSLSLSRWLIAEKIANSIETLRTSLPRSPATQLAISRIEQDATLMRRRPPSTVNDLLGIEGRVAVAYFEAWKAFPLRWTNAGRRPIPEDWKRIGTRSSMLGGKHYRNRHATHPANAMLNYAYGVLEGRIRTHIVARGFDPTLGYFHGAYRGKAALVYDLMEPLRPVVDGCVLSLVQAHTFAAADFAITGDGVCRINPQLARSIVQRVDRTLQTDAVISGTVARLLRT